MNTNNIHVIGDSHSVYCFSRIKEAKIHWLGPVTMHRVGRDKFAQLNFKHSFDQGDVAVFVFGEIDVRCHIGRVAQLHGIDTQTVCEDLVQSYISAIQHFSKIHLLSKAIVFSCPSPGDHISNPDLPTFGTIAERAEITRILNNRLKDACRQSGIDLMPFPKIYSSRKGILRENFSDGSVHVAPSRTRPIYEMLQRYYGRKLTFIATSRKERLYRTIMRALPSLDRTARLSKLEPNPAHTRSDIGYPTI